MLPCNGCAYREPIPGDEHSRCLFDWFTTERKAALVDMFANVTECTARWFRFPFNYDPLWGPDVCSARSETREPKNTVTPSPLADLLSLLR